MPTDQPGQPNEDRLVAALLNQPAELDELARDHFRSSAAGSHLRSLLSWYRKRGRRVFATLRALHQVRAELFASQMRAEVLQRLLRLSRQPDADSREACAELLRVLDKPAATAPTRQRPPRAAPKGPAASDDQIRGLIAEADDARKKQLDASEGDDA